MPGPGSSGRTGSAEPGLDHGREGRPLRRGHVSLALVERHRPDVVVLRGDVPVAHQRDLRLGVGGQPAGAGVAQPGQPVQLVGQVRVAELAPVGDVERPDPHATAGRADRAGLGFGRVAPGRHLREADLDVLQPDPGQDGHAVPLRVADVRHLIAQRLEPVGRELVVAGLGLLHRDHVEVTALDPVGDPVDPGPDGVDVPRSDPHPANLSRGCDDRRVRSASSTASTATPRLRHGASPCAGLAQTHRASEVRRGSDPSAGCLSGRTR